MTIRQLKDLIADLPDNMQVAVRNEEYDFPIRPAAKADVVNVEFREDHGEASLCDEKMLVITHD